AEFPGVSASRHSASDRCGSLWRVVMPRTTPPKNSTMRNGGIFWGSRLPPLLLTSLPEDEYSAEQVADCYRLRWQIELAFKRLKSLLHLDALRAKEPELAKAWIFANLLAAFLIDDIIQPSLDFPPRSAGSEKKN
ncbi:transposase, partial [Klebsiella pneumoniae]|uniref:transposase n=1 Tax=Klebsiella pneumoniae TaxID=573 RepID=UPI001D0D4CDE